MPIPAERRALYGPDWPALSRSIRFDRARRRCECDGRCKSPKHAGAGRSNRCLATHEVAHPITGSIVVLTVAHLDHDPTHNDPANLLAMCQACHLAYDADQHARTRAARRTSSTNRASAEPTLQLFDEGSP